MGAQWEEETSPILSFQALEMSHAGQYICQICGTSPELKHPITAVSEPHTIYTFYVGNNKLGILAH